MAEIEVFDFDSRFTKDYLKWCTAHPEEAKNEDKMMRLLPHMHKKWMETPKSWLGNKTVLQYFNDIDDISSYLTIFIEYMKNDLSVPEPLLDAIIERKNEAYPTFLNILYSKQPEDMDEDQFSNLQAAVINLINEMELEHPYVRYIQILSSATENNDLVEEIYETLEAVVFEEGMREKLLTAYKNCGGFAKDCFLDLLSNYVYNEEITQIIITRIENAKTDELPFLASTIAKQADERAVEILRNMINRTDIGFYTYDAIKNALESLTGEVLPDRDFSGDPDYDLITMEEDEQQ